MKLGHALATFFVEPKLVPLAAAALVLTLVLASLSRQRTSRRGAALVSPALAVRLGHVKWSTAPALVLAALVTLGTGLALARPRWGKTTETAERRGADVVILLDTSASMRATDVSPSRFVLAKEAAASLLSRIGSDHVALVACEGEAQTLVPLTLDTAAVGLFLDSLEPGIGSKPGTSLAAGLSAVSEAFPPGAATGKNVVLISDGEDLEGGIEEAIDKAKRENIVVHTVFVGAPGGKGAPVPEVDVAGRMTGYKSGEGGPVLSKPDPDLMRKLAAGTGGSFSIVSPGRTDLDGVAQLVDLSARRPLSEALLTSLEERFQWPLSVAVGALGLLLLGISSVPLPRRLRKTAAVLFLAIPATLRAQAPAQPNPVAPPVSGAAPAAEPAPVPTPATLVEKIASRPPFTTARSEAKAGKRALDEKQNAEAVKRFAREVELAPKDPTGAYNLGTALSRTGRAEEALASLDKARQAPSQGLASDAAYNAGETYYRAQKYEEAAKAFREALRKKPGDPDASFNYELCVRRAEAEKKKQQQKQNKDGKSPQQGSPTPTPGPQNGQGDKDKKERENQQFAKDAKMSREKAEQILSAVQQADLDEQKRKIAEQKAKRHVTRDW